MFSKSCPPAIRSSLLNIYMLYGLWILERHISTMYQGTVLSFISFSYVFEMYYPLTKFSDTLPHSSYGWRIIIEFTIEYQSGPLTFKLFDNKVVWLNLVPTFLLNLIIGGKVGYRFNTSSCKDHLEILDSSCITRLMLVFVKIIFGANFFKDAFDDSILYISYNFCFDWKWKMNKQEGPNKIGVQNVFKNNERGCYLGPLNGCLNGKFFLADPGELSRIFSSSFLTLFHPLFKIAQFALKSSLLILVYAYGG